MSSSPASVSTAVVISDTTNLKGGQSRALYVGVGGDLSVLDVSGVSTVFKNVQSGSVLPVRAVRVNATGTTATDIVALY